MKIARRFLSMLLSLCLVLGALPGLASAYGSLPFTDVDPSDWYYDSVRYVYEKGIMGGTDATTFSPDATTTRGMIVTVLHRLEGSPYAAGADFSDVEPGQWYANAVAWASANGIVDGYGGGMFGPNDPITREQMASILYRYSQSKRNYLVRNSGGFEDYTDSAEISEYAINAMKWAVGSGLISGDGGKLNAKGKATRAQAAAILDRYCNKALAVGSIPTGTVTPDIAGKVDIGTGTDTTATYTITYDLNYGANSLYTTQTVNAGEPITAPASPERRGYHFVGWFTDMFGVRPFDFKQGATSDVTLYAYWSETYVAPQVSTVEYFTLINTGEQDGSYILQLTTNIDVGTIDLKCYKNGEFAQNILMYDDGETNGDDIKGDGTYTAMVTVDASVDTYFVAQYGNYTSNKYYFYSPIQDETIAEMEVIDKEIDNLLDSLDSAEKTEAEKAAECNALLNTLAANNQIEDVHHDMNSKVFTFQYSEGILGGIMYGDFDDGGTEKQNGPEGAAPADGESQTGDETASDEPVREEAPDSYEVYDTFGDDVPMYYAETNDSEESEEVGKAVILNSFPEFETDPGDIAYRTNFYHTLKSSWDTAGLTTDLNESPTVADYENLAGYDVICVSTHGSIYTTWDGTEYPAICLAEQVSAANDKAYQAELKSQQIAKVSGRYWILPSFFTEHYKAGELSDSFVYSECCMALSRGNGANSSAYNYRMANAFTVDCSAKAYIGFHNSVFADYSRELMEEYVNKLIEGKTSQEAYNAAVQKMGADHEEWFNKKYTSITLEEYRTGIDGAYDANVDVAYPVLNGDVSAVLVNPGLQNGGFEKYNPMSTTPRYWDCIGDVRTLAKMGPVSPTEQKRMAVVTSGLGSNASVSIGGGTEGSKMSQTFKVPETASKLVFSYNFISEEPMEWVGTQYDDAFVVQVASGNNIFHDEKYESVNTSSWYEVTGIDFKGGDHTTYETHWKTDEIDISSYRGKTITLSFMIYDVGDSIYDSACVIDNVYLQ